MELPRFGYAVKCLAEAASTMSAAAQAMALAAQAFSTASEEFDKLCNSTEDLNTDMPPGPLFEPHQFELSIGAVDHENGPEVLRNRGRIDIVDNDYYLSEEDDDKYINALLRRQQSAEPSPEIEGNANEKESTARPPPHPSVPPYPTPQTPPALPNPPSSFIQHPSDTPTIVTSFERHLLVDLETEVIPTVCGLAQRFPKVVCYMQCALPSIMTYHRIIKHITESTVYAVTRPNMSQSDHTWGAFNRQARAIILLPETLSSHRPLQATGDICVVHVGWPSSAQRYRAQLAIHDAPCSVLVACTQDKGIFTSGEELVGETAPWPSEDKGLLETETSRLFPKFEAAILEIPREMKDKLYQDWIEVHGPRGHRCVSNWDSVTLVNRANLYICDVLGYYKSANEWPTRLPPVPLAFVSRNGLESAVDNGVLFLRDGAPGLNHPMDLPKDTGPMKEPSSVHTPEEPSPTKLACPVGSATPTGGSGSGKLDSMENAGLLVPNSDQNAAKPPVDNSPTHFTSGTSDPHPISSNDSNPKAQSKSESVPPQTSAYFVVLEDFHLIPAICMLAKDKSYKNVVCYVQIVGVMQTLITQIHALTSKPIFIVATPNSAALPGALKALTSPTGCIVFCNYLLPLCEPLRDKTIHRIVHAGWTGKLDLYYQQVDTTSDTQNSIIMTQSQFSAIPDPDTIFGASRLNIPRSLFDPATFDAVVVQWESQLNQAPEKALNGCYMEWIAYHGRGQNKVETWSVIELVTQANIFAEKVLKRQGGRAALAVSEGLARHMKLQPAIQAGVLQNKTMGDATPVANQKDRAESLAHAAECLARAAAKLAEAAKAMSLVAGALSQGKQGKAPGISTTTGNPTGSDPTDPTTSTDAATNEDEGVGLPQPYSLLLDDEADVLLVLCSLIYDLPKVVCYFACGAQSLKFYKSLIAGVTAANVLIADPLRELSVDRCYTSFLKASRSTLLLSESDILSTTAKEMSDYAVIHVGWPVSRRQYVAQRRTHHALTNLLLVYSGDKDLYSSGSAIMSQTVAWPGDTGGFRASVDIFRPLFEEGLSETLFELKEEVYMDWIHLHSHQGPRAVGSWTPISLVNRANRFVLGPLAYRSPKSLVQKSSLQMASVDLLPEVSTDFITQQGLQSAVDEGLLRVESDAEGDKAYEYGASANSDLRISAEGTRPDSTPGALFNHLVQHQNPTEEQNGKAQRQSVTQSLSGLRSNSLPKIPLAQRGTLRVEEDLDGSNSPETHLGQTARPESVPTQTKFQPTSGHTYFTLEEEFDAIPLICFISKHYGKVICFLEGQGALRSYQDLFISITGRLAISSTIANNPQAIEEAVVRFLCTPPPAILLLACTTRNLPPVLKEGTLDCCLYWGFYDPLRHVQNNRSLIDINCSTTIIIVTAIQRSGIHFPKDTKKHPSAAIAFDLSENSILAPMRNKTASILMSAKGKRIVGALYATRVFNLGNFPRSSLSAEDVARRANQYAARVLLHGDEADGSDVFPPVGERPPVPKKTVEIFKLEPAVEAGLLTIEI